MSSNKYYPWDGEPNPEEDYNKELRDSLKAFDQYEEEQELTKQLASPNVVGNPDEEKKGGADTEKFKELVMSKMSNKLPTAESIVNDLAHNRDDDTGEMMVSDIREDLIKTMEEYATIKCEALKEENERLHDKVNDLQALLLGLLDGNLCSAAGDDVIKQAFKVK